MDPMDSLIEILGIWGANFKNNSIRLFTDMYDMFQQRDWIRAIRLVAIIGGYLLVRRWLSAHAAKKQEREFARQSEEDKLKEQGVTMSSNALRGAGGKKVSFEESESEEEGKATGNEPQWGKKAKKRQRQVVKKLLEQQEEQLRQAQGDEEDKDIMEHLVDYEEGKDGW